MMNLEVKIKNISTNPLPQYQTPNSAGMDLCAFLAVPLLIKPGHRMLIGTGLYIELPSGYEAQIRSRSGLALKHGVSVLNSPGTIDADYRGEVKILLINFGDQDFEIKNGDRIAQMVISRHSSAQWILADELSDTERGAGGYGSTGV